MKTEEEWIRAGELIFDAPITTGRLGGLATTSDLYLRDPRWYEQTRAPLAKDGTLPFFRYVVAEKGHVQIGILACGPKSNDATFTTHDFELLTTMAHQTGAALRNARLVADLRKLNESMTALNASLK